MFIYLYINFLHYRFLDTPDFLYYSEKWRLVSSTVKFNKLSENNLIFLLSLIIASQLPIFQGNVNKIICQSSKRLLPPEKKRSGLESFKGGPGPRNSLKMHKTLFRRKTPKEGDDPLSGVFVWVWVLSRLLRPEKAWSCLLWSCSGGGSVSADLAKLKLQIDYRASLEEN